MAIGLELGIIKFIAKAAKLYVTRHILEVVRYSDNICHSFKTNSEMHDVKENLYQAFSKYSMDLKYCISSIENEKSVLETPGREGGEIERLLGLN